MRDEQRIESEIQKRGLTAPRLTPTHIDRLIVEVEYHVFFGLCTVCVLKLKNGFCAVGESAPVSAANFNADLGRQIAYANARNKIWGLEGYAMRSALADRGEDGSGNG